VLFCEEQDVSSDIILQAPIIWQKKHTRKTAAIIILKTNTGKIQVLIFIALKYIYIFDATLLMSRQIVIKTCGVVCHAAQEVDVQCNGYIKGRRIMWSLTI